jgi:hypothetical protein
VIFAAVGALAGQVLGLLELKNIVKANRPNLRDFWYWFPFVISPLLGGGLSYAYLLSGVDLKPLVAINVGIAAPIILRSMAELKNPPQIQTPPGA